MPAQQQQFIETAFLTGITGTVPAGTVLCLTADGTRYMIASLENRTAASRPAACVALTAGDANNIAVEAQFVGVIPNAITGLGTGAAEYVRTSDSGVLERTATLDATVVGHCDADGTAYVCFPLAGWNFAGVAAALPDGSVQYRVPSGAGALGGAAHVFIASDGWMSYGAAPPTVGAIRFSNGLGIVYRNAANDTDVGLLNTDNTNAVSIGDAAAGGDLYLKSGGTQIVFKVSGQIENFLYKTGVHFWTAGTTPVSDPVGGADVWVDSTSFHIMQRTPDGTVYDLTDTGGGPAKEQDVDITSGNQTVDLSDGKILKIIGTGGDTLTVTVTPQPTSAALADTFEVRNTSNVSIIFTNALSGKTTMDVSSNASGNLRTTPDGISGVWFNADGTTGGVTV